MRAAKMPVPVVGIASREVTESVTGVFGRTKLVVRTVEEPVYADHWKTELSVPSRALRSGGEVDVFSFDYVGLRTDGALCVVRQDLLPDGSPYAGRTKDGPKILTLHLFQVVSFVQCLGEPVWDVMPDDGDVPDLWADYSGNSATAGDAGARLVAALTSLV
ncbi:hypothetical protein B2J88_08910 [Rhodococcus sp. SRB_17]|nr:hypothetical protein [Rhodococcus sp. SRB_17]